MRVLPTVLAVLVLMAGVSVVETVAQDPTEQPPVEIIIFPERDSLTVYVPGNQVISLEGLAFEVVVDGNRETFVLFEYTSFVTYRPDTITAPACFRLERIGTQEERVLQGECPSANTAFQALAEANVWWHDDIRGHRLSFDVLQQTDEQIDVIVTCGAGQQRCLAPYAQPPLTATPVTVTPAQGGPVAPTATPLPLALSNALVSAQVFTSTQNTGWRPFLHVHANDPTAAEMALVPIGEFMMGHDGENSDEERPVHRQIMRVPYWIDRYEVTNVQFVDFLNTTDNRRAYLSEQGRIQLDGVWRVVPGFEQHPVQSVTWYGARDYCAYRGMRLPTEREWEYAARGVSSWQYPWQGNVIDATRANVGGSGTTPVGARPGGASWVGAEDMTGNVWEWTSTIDDPDRYPYPYVADERDADGTARRRIIRGGAWDTTPENRLHTANRFSGVASDGEPNEGFRCVRDVMP
ncbi:MAG: formylglycine-generating enzyme family protein [Chloroflexota bacterium]